MDPRISVIIPCYRCADTIGRALSSVSQQTRSVNEVILVEDCSDDGGATLAELHTLQDLHKALAIQILALEKNVGPGAARNAGWALATGDYLAFLDADDSWHPAKIEIQTNWMQAHPDAVLCSGLSVHLLSGDRPQALTRTPIARRVSGFNLLLRNCFPTRTVMLRRDIAFRFDPVKRSAEDYLLWLTIVLSGMPAYAMDLPLAYSYKAEYGAGGLTANLWKMEKGVMDTYRRICRDGYVSSLTSYALIAFSFLKFVRRWLRSTLSRVTRT